MSDSFDVIIIGGGPGGYNAAIRAGQLGLTVACIDKRGSFGGTCLNIGCIPSKAMLHASELYEEAGHSFAQMGIKVGKPSVELPALLKYKEQNVESNVKGVEFLFKKNKIETFHGSARIVAPGQVEVKDGKCTMDGKLAGSVLTMDLAVRNVTKFAGWSLQNAVRAATLNPARAAGLAQSGVSAPGAEANLLVLSPFGEVRQTFVRGRAS